MARTAKALSPLEIGRIKKVGYYPVGTVPGLALRVLDSGARMWVLRAMIGGRRREMGLGGFPAVPVAAAWDAARVARAKIKDGTDPIEEGRARRSALAAERAAAITFEGAATAYIAAQEGGWRNDKHAQQWRNTLGLYAFPVIGNLLVADVEQTHVLRVIEPIWATKPETASRLRGRIEAVLAWATVRGYRSGANPATWKGHLDKLLPSPKKAKAVRHHPALPYNQVAAFVAALRSEAGTAARALELAVLTAGRSGEIRGAEWSEFDLDAATWTIPKSRMKAAKEHIVALSAPAVALLKALKNESASTLVFPGMRGGPLSDMTLAKVVRRLDAQRVKVDGKGWRDQAGAIVTPHGFRSTFRDWSGELSTFPREVIEHALAHQLKDKAEAAYARGTLLDKRRRLMEAWAAYCGKPAASATVTPISAAQAAA